MRMMSEWWIRLWDRIAAPWRESRAAVAARRAALAAAGRWREDDVQCKECGCTDWNACVTENGETCCWVRDDLCSACASPQERDHALQMYRY